MGAIAPAPVKKKNYFYGRDRASARKKNKLF
jgi:hypothetical protein